MLLMMFIMSFPLLGIGLFFVLPFAAALPAYLAVLTFFGIYQWLMTRAMRLPPRTGTGRMVGSTGVVLNWEGGSGQLLCEGEVWQAAADGRRTFAHGEKVTIDRMKGLTLWVSPTGGRGETPDLVGKIVSSAAGTRPQTIRDVTKW